MLRILFLCTHNSCRSITAEALLRHLGGKRTLALSAGSHPSGEVNKDALAMLEKHAVPTANLHSKAWDVFANNKEKIDIVITVCDAAAEEACPLFPGAPVKAHWGMADPARKKGTVEEVEAAFLTGYKLLEARLRHLLALPIEKMSPEVLEQALAHIGNAAYKTAA